MLGSVSLAQNSKTFSKNIVCACCKKSFSNIKNNINNLWSL